MAKTAKKKANPAINPRSRAAKRATSPSINVDKSITSAPRAHDATPSLAGVRGGGGIVKKRKVKQMTRGQRARQEKGLVRAEAVMDQLAVKLDTSKSRQKRIDQRRGGWDDVNSATKEESRKAMKAPGRGVVDDEWEDVQDRGDDVDMVPTNVFTATAVEEPTTGTNSDGNAHTNDDVDLIT